MVPGLRHSASSLSPAFAAAPENRHSFAEGIVWTWTATVEKRTVARSIIVAAVKTLSLLSSIRCPVSVLLI